MTVDELKTRYRHLAWSNAHASTDQLLRAALLEPRFHTLLDFVAVLGLEALDAAWADLLRSGHDPRVERVRAQTERCLHHLHEGHSLAASSHRRALAQA